MRLYYQLTTTEQDTVVDHCVSMVLENIIENGLPPENDAKIIAKFDAMKLGLEKLSSKEDKSNYIMDDVDMADAIFEAATEMARNAFYHEPNELVFFPDAMAIEEEDHDDGFIVPQTKRKDLN